jgi:hypothetical protein
MTNSSKAFLAGIGGKVRQLREALGLSQVKLAQKARVHVNVVGRVDPLVVAARRACVAVEHDAHAMTPLKDLAPVVGQVGEFQMHYVGIDDFPAGGVSANLVDTCGAASSADCGERRPPKSIQPWRGAQYCIGSR